MKQLCKLGLCCTILAIIPFSVTAQTTKKSDSSDSGEKVYDRVLHSTVWVLIPVGGGKARSGSGSLIDNNRRLILTNYHVVGEKDEGVVYFPIYTKGKLVAERQAYMTPGKGIPCKVLVKDSRRDLAVLQMQGPVPAEAKPLKLAKESPRPGQKIHSIGNPSASGALWIYTEGSVRQVYNKKFVTGGNGQNQFEVDARIVETQSPINAGDSGGPVVNDNAELVAVVQGHIPDALARSVSMFIDVTEVRDLLVSKRIAKLPSAKETDQPKEVQPTAEVEKTKPEEDSAAKKERDAARQLKYVKEFVADKKNDLARSHCYEIIEKYPDTKAAKEAKELLEKLKE